MPVFGKQEKLLQNKSAVKQNPTYQLSVLRVLSFCLL